MKNKENTVTEEDSDGKRLDVRRNETERGVTMEEEEKERAEEERW